MFRLACKDMTKTITSFCTGMFVFACLACSDAAEDGPPADGAAQPAVDVSALDPNADPCEDFYRYACGGWIDRTEIPPDEVHWSRSISEIAARNQVVLRAIVEDAAAGVLDDPDAERIGAFWTACMSEEGADADFELFRSVVARTDAAEDSEALALRLAELHLAGVDAFFYFGQDHDLYDTSQTIGGLDVNGISLPDRDLYLSTDEEAEALRLDFVEHVAEMFILAGADASDAASDAATVLMIETTLAEAALSPVERRDPETIYNRIGRKGLLELSPSFPWDLYFEAVGAGDVQGIAVTEPEYFAAFDELWRDFSLEDKKAYLRWRSLRMASDALGEAFREERFRFDSQLTGQEEPAERWKICLEETNDIVGQALGRIFVERVVRPETKELAEALMHRITDAFSATLDESTWMSEETRREARKKLAELRIQISHPDVWPSLDGLEFSRTSYLENLMRAQEYAMRNDLSKIGQPPDLDEWYEDAHLVNAYYWSTRNQVTLPAGILQPPFFSVDAPLSANAGAIGMLMGHELVHAFDDMGRQFDGQGNLRDWWSEASSQAYEERAACVEKQYSAYEALDGLYVDGALTLGENIADLGGLGLAWRAFAITQEGLHEAGPQGFSPAQEFFLSFAQVLCDRTREEALRLLVSTNEHAPYAFRVNGVVTNLPAFREAFQCETGQPMAPEQVCKVW